MGLEMATAARAVVERVAGPSRVETAVVVSRRLFPEGECLGSPLCMGEVGPKAVVVASATSYADAAVGVPLAALEGGPLLLTFADRLPVAIAEEVRRLAPRGVLVVGGELAISNRVVDALRATGVPQVERVGGSDRYATAAAVASRFPPGEGVFAAVGDAAGDGWQGALVASASAASARRPLLLVASDDVLPPATVGALAELEASAAVIVLRRDALRSSVFDQLRAEVGVVNASWGTGPRTDWWEVSAMEADRSRLLGGDPAATWVASGDVFADALPAAAAAGLTGGTFLLVDGEDLAVSEASRSWLTVAAPEVAAVGVVGGSVVVDEAVMDQLEDVLTTRDPPFRDFVVTATVNRAEYSAGDPVEVEIEACNIDDAPITQYFPDTRFLDADVAEASVGAVVSYANPVTSPAVQKVTWGPGECEGYRQTWDQRRGEREPLPEAGVELPEPLVPPGDYLWAIRWRGQEERRTVENPQVPSYPDTASSTFTIHAGRFEPLRSLWRSLL